MKRTAQIVLACIALALVAILVFTPKPWTVETILRKDLGLTVLLRDHIARGVWYGAAIDLVIVLLLLATAGLWAGRCLPAPPSGRSNRRTRLGKRARIGVITLTLAATVAAGVTAYPRLSHSLWGDEDFTLRFHLLGHFTRATDHARLADGTPYFRKLSWRDTAFGYQTTNNHFLYTITGRLIHQAWQKAHDLRSYQFDERVLRAAPYTAGLLSIGAWVLLAVRLGIPWSTLPFVLLLCCNPWFIRYITEARGYAFIFLLAPLSLAALIQALDHGRWRTWMSYGLCQFLMLYSWPGIALHVAFVNLFVGGLLAWRGIRPPPPEDGAKPPPGSSGNTQFPLPRGLEQPMRWAVVNLATLLLLLPLIAPAYPQIQHYLTETQLQIPITGSWIANLLGLLALGIPFDNYYEGFTGLNPHYLCIESIAETRGPWIYVYLCGFYIFLLFGLARCCLRTRYGLLLVLSLFGAASSFWALSHANERYIFHWYFVYLQPFVVLLVGTGMVETGRILYTRLVNPDKNLESAGLRAGLATGALGLVGLCAFYFAAPCLKILRKHSLDPLRESVLYVRGSSDPTGPGMRNYLLGHVHFGAYCYDAHAFPISQAFSNDATYPGITKLMRASDALQIPLFFTVGFPSSARSILPQIMNMLDDTELFEPVRMFWSSEPQLVREVFRYRGGFFSPRQTPEASAPSPWAEKYGSPVPPEMIPNEEEQAIVRQNANAKVLAPFPER